MQQSRLSARSRRSVVNFSSKPSVNGNDQCVSVFHTELLQDIVSGHRIAFVKYIITFLIFWAISSQTYAQDKLVFSVLDEETELSIPEVSVFVFSGSGYKPYFSDEAGKVYIETGSQFDSLLLSHPDYQSLTIMRAEKDDHLPRVRLRPLTNQLPAFVFRAYPRRDEESVEPVKIDRIKLRDIALASPQTSADLAGISEHVFIQKSQLGGGSPMMRGFSANNVLLVVDGIRMNNAIFRGGNLQNVIMIDPNLVVETDVLLGPGSVMYGSDALGGVFEFETKKPKVINQDKMHYHGSLALRGSSANRENSWHIDFGFGKKKWAALSSISISNFNDLRMGSNGPDFYKRPELVESQVVKDTIIQNPSPLIQYFTSYSQINLAQKFQWQPDTLTTIDWQTTYTTSSPIPRYDRLIQYSGDSLRYANWQYGPQQWALNALSINRKTKNSFFSDELSFNIGLQNVEESREQRRRNDVEFIQRVENVTALNINLDLGKKWKGGELFYGVEHVWNKVNSKGTSTFLDSVHILPAASRYPDGSIWSSSAAYLMNHLRLGMNSRLVAGLRYSQVTLDAPFSSEFYDFPFEKISFSKGAFNASLGFQTKIGKDQHLSLNVSSGFRAPNVDDIGKIFDSEPGKVVVPNADLIPEYVYTADLGWKGKLFDALSISANVFYTYVDNLIQRSNFTLNGADSILYNSELLQVQSLANSGSGIIYGTEFSAEWKLNNILRLHGAYNYMQGGSESGEPIRHVTPQFGRAGVTYVDQVLKIVLFTQFQGELSADELALTERSKTHLYLPDDNGLPYSPSWWTLNIKANYTMSKSLQLSGGIENILDRRYRPYSSGITAPGLNVYFGIRSRF